MLLSPESSPVPMSMDGEEIELHMSKVGSIQRDQRQKELLQMKPTNGNKDSMEILSKEGDDESSDGRQGHFDDNTQILPVPPRASFSSVHQDFLLLVRQTGEMHVQGEEHILEMRAALVAAYAETLHDQGELEALLDCLYELDEDMDEQIALYEDFISEEEF
jgi:hypothetical protein